MKKYDYIIAGAGCAGLSLAYRMCLHPELSKRSILILDKDEKKANDRTWCFWSKKPILFDDIVYRKWKKVTFKSDDVIRTDHLSTYTYHLIRGADFYAHTKKVIKANPNIHWKTQEISIIRQDEEGPFVIAEGEQYRTHKVFNSCYRWPDEKEQDPNYNYLFQHFKGWEIETKDAAFDPKGVTLMDFNTPQKGCARFYYILPFSEKRALVEYTLFSDALLEKEAYERALRNYIEKQLGIKDYNILAHEFGVIPMTDAPLTPTYGSDIVPIGTPAGAVKPTTGYAFLRIQQQADTIIQQLASGQQPSAQIVAKKRYGFYDTLLLYLLSHHGHLAKSIFTQLFKNNKVERVFTFLNERAVLWQEARIFVFLPIFPFLYAVWMTQFFNKMKRFLLPQKTATIKRTS